jgi:hypothetical protein
MLNHTSVIHSRLHVSQFRTVQSRALLIAALLATALLEAGPARAAAANFTVDSRWDWPDNNLADHLCQTNEPLPRGRTKKFCSLRAAIQQANADGGGNVITVPAIDAHLGIKGLDANQNLVPQDPALVNDDVGCMTLHVLASTTIKGAATNTTTIDGEHFCSVFTVGDDATPPASPTLNVSAMTITRGGEAQRPQSGRGGGLFVFRGSTVNLTGVNVRNNQTTGFGSGLHNSGTLNLLDSVVELNCGIGGSGGGFFQGTGGGIHNTSTGVLSLERTTVASNYDIRGAGLNNENGKVSIFNSTFSGNVARSNGGGIRNSGSAATMAISQSTITSNWAHVAHSPPTVARGSDCFTLDRANLREGDVTDADTFGGANGGGIVNINGGQIAMAVTILADNHLTLSPTVGSGLSTATPDCFSPDLTSSPGPSLVSSYRDNLVGIFNNKCNMRDERCGHGLNCTPGAPPTFDFWVGIVNPPIDSVTGFPLHPPSPLSPMLDTLHFDGGPTPVHALMQGSGALDGYIVALNGPETDPMPVFGVDLSFFFCPRPGHDTDQRSGTFTRPKLGQITSFGERCDIGAYEVQNVKLFAQAACSGNNGVLRGATSFVQQSCTRDDAGDVTWEDVDSTHQRLAPKNGAQVALLGSVDFSDLTLQDLKGASYSFDPLNSSQIAPGTIVGVKNSAGHFSKLLVSRVDSDLALTSFETFQRPVKVSGLSVADSANASDWSVRSNLQVGDKQYGDRTFTVTSVPAQLQGATWVRTANDSKTATQNPLVNFTTDRDSEIHLGIDRRIGRRPWMDGTWIDTGLTVTNDESTPRTFQLFKKFFPAGAVAVGPNADGNSSSMYILVVP